jgi:hypothetical protein
MLSRPTLLILIAAAAPLAQAALPAVQRGEWVLKSKVDGRPHEARMCGNPLDKVAAAIAAARGAEKLGCSVRVENPVPRTVNVSVDCPAGRGRSTWLSVNAASMQSVWIELRRGARRESVHAERVGDCSR